MSDVRRAGNISELRHSRPARFIVFEGLDGSGKSTQLQLLANQLAARDLPCILTREPSDKNPVGRLTGQLTRGGGKAAYPLLDNETLALLFAADRIQHVTEEILPALQSGTHVLCDRYYYSNFAYQGGEMADESLFDRIFQYNRRAMEILKPDLVVFVDVNPQECLRRINLSRDNTGLYENADKLMHARARYMEAFARLQDSERIAVIDANGLSPEEVSARIWERVSPLV